MRIGCFGLVLGVLAAIMRPAVAQTPEPDDLLTLAKGAVLVSASHDPTAAIALTDGDPSSAWSTSTKKHSPPYPFVFELLSPTQLSKVGIHGAGERPGGVAGGSAKDVLIEGSADGPETGYVELARVSAAEVGATLADVTHDTPVRWLRFTVQGAQSPDAAFLYFTEVIAQGQNTVPDDPDRFTGVFQTGRKNFVELVQADDLILGCFTDNSGLSTGTVTGSVVDGVALLSWRSDQGITGTAFLTVDSTGALSGVRYRQRSRSVWAGPVAPEGTTTPCSPTPAAAETSAPVDPIVTGLETEGVARLYGIHFEVDSDVPKPSATGALERLLAALIAAPDLVVDIEGHTDSDGEDAYNLDLSNRRAQSVVNWLVAQGINAARLGPVGKGESEPVASNDTADGKALNRRVDIRRR
jgi:outer membrane protein OmpA-like peptidoglycan-associated protein